jgi:predicted secreted acid phosphatase
MDIELIHIPVAPIINKFRDVKLSAEIQNPLVILDIDDTVITWKREFTKFISENTPKLDPNLEDDVKTMFNYFVMLNEPDPTDLDGFNDLVKRVREKGGEVMFLTARSPEHRSLTLQRLTSVGIDDPDNYRIYFTGNKTTKGKYISKYVDLTQYGEVVFVDDMHKQLISVHQLFPQVRLYQFAL